MSGGTRYTLSAVAVVACAVILLRTVAWPERRPADAVVPPDPARTAAVRPPPETYHADLPALRDRGRLRILYLETGVEPRERQLLEQFSRARGLTPDWIEVDNPWQLLTDLSEGRGDLAASVAEPVAAGPAMPVRDTLSWGVSRQQVVGRSGAGLIEAPQDLAVRQVAIRYRSPAWSRIAAQRKTSPAMDVITIPDDIDDRQVLERVNSGRYDLAVMDSQALQSLLADYPDLKVQLSLGSPEHRRWLVHRDAGRLRAALNRFLNKKHLEMNLARVYREDLPSLERRKVLRLITYRSPVNVFFDNGRLKGFEYELVRRFADEHGMRVDVILAADQAEMLSLLKQGRGDIVAASLPGDSLPEDAGLRYSRAYNFAAPVLVGRAHDSVLDNPGDLDGRRIYLPAESPWRGRLEALQRRGIDVAILDAAEGLDTEAVLFRVARGMYDLTVISSHKVNAEFSRQLNLRVHFPLGPPGPQVWAVRRSDTQLLSALNGFIQAQYRHGFYNVLYARYIERPGDRRASSGLLAEVDRLSPFDEIVYKYAERHDFDWRLIVAQMYQESRFDPAAVSYAGAEGLMQLLPGTAEQMGVTKRDDPEHSIQGGIRYLDYLRGRFQDVSQLEDRTWFTLAAYNAGFRRVRQARRLAEDMGLNPDRWFDNVERAMLVLARPYRHEGEWARHCRCGQTVAYVREIRTLYNNYVRLTENLRAADARRADGPASPLLN